LGDAGRAILCGMRRFRAKVTFSFDVPSFEDAPAEMQRLEKVAADAGFAVKAATWESVPSDDPSESQGGGTGCGPPITPQGGGVRRLWDRLRFGMWGRWPRYPRD
jgi:hypothetical protein